MVKIVKLKEIDLYRIVKKVLNESLIDNLPSKEALKKLEEEYDVKIENSHIQNEKNQEGVEYYEDNNKLDSDAVFHLKKLLEDLYSEFPDAPRVKNKNCDNIIGCISGYRGYMTQAHVFGQIMKSRNQTVAQRQKVSALPGFSQHHTGKTFDILSVNNQFWDSNPELKKWVEKNVREYGFKISYPSKGVLREAEPWHITYIGGGKSGQENQTEQKKIDNFYSSNQQNTEFEKKLEKKFELTGCSPKKIYTESPKLIDIKPDSDKVIRIGHKGSDVEKIQKKLIYLGYNVGVCGVDGLFGPKTKEAIEKFQENNSLDVTSAVDFNTLVKLKSSQQNGEDKKQKSSQIKSSDSNHKIETISEEEYIVIKPKNSSAKNVHVFFGGADTSGYAKNTVNKSAMQKYIPILEPYSQNKIIVITHHYNELQSVKKFVEEKFDGNITSIAGFSQGGEEVWNYADNSNFSLVGLIDPSTYKINLEFGSNTILYCDPNNWGTSGFYGQTRKRLEWYCENKEKYNSQVICFNEGGTHMNFGILKKFYQQFGSKI